jgi:hypothetical protein
MSLETYLIPEDFDTVPLPYNLYAFKKIEDMSSDRYVSELMEIHRENGFGPEGRMCDKDIGWIPGFSIVGGYSRNHMLNVQTITDVDVVTNSVPEVCNALSKVYRRLDTTTVVNTYQMPDNTLHLLSNSYHRIGPEFEGRIFIDPVTFDFTVNLGSISAYDGHLYAPPVTLFDIKNKILRPSIQPTDYLSYQIMNLSVLLRAIRFSVKYDMTVHSSILCAIDIFFAVTERTKTVDDATLYHTLKHLLDETQEVRTKFFAVLRSLNFIDTDRYNNFDDYFKFISDNCEHQPRSSPMAVHSSIHSY